jgi:hypothetical protein
MGLVTLFLPDTVDTETWEYFTISPHLNVLLEQQTDDPRLSELVILVHLTLSFSYHHVSRSHTRT